jgi:hypothetical protein
VRSKDFIAPPGSTRPKVAEVLGCLAFGSGRFSYRLSRLRRPALHFRLQRRRLKAAAGAKKVAAHQAADPVRVSTFAAARRLRFINFVEESEAIALRAGMRRGQLAGKSRCRLTDL